MRSIKFSHEYTKMPGKVKKSLLLQVIKTHYKDLSTVFVAYDTEILGTLEHYPLPKTDLIILVLYSPNEHLWTTIRRYTPGKFDYYQSLVGQELEIQIIKEDQS